MDLEIADWCWQGSSAFQLTDYKRDQKALKHFIAITLYHFVQIKCVHIHIFAKGNIVLSLSYFASLNSRLLTFWICPFYICHLWVILSLCALCYFKPESSFVTASKRYTKHFCTDLHRHLHRHTNVYYSWFVSVTCFFFVFFFSNDFKGAVKVHSSRAIILILNKKRKLQSFISKKLTIFI